MKNEIWKDVKGFEGLYQVSNYGRVKSLRRWVNRSNGGYWIPERIRSLGTVRGGYLFVPLYKDGEKFPRRINRLVAEAFLEGYSEGKDVHHIDGDKTNNRVDNLICLSSEEHHKEHPGRAVIGIKDGKTIVFSNCTEATKYGFDSANVSRCCKAALLPEGHPRRKKYATHKGYEWRYATELRRKGNDRGNESLHSRIEREDAADRCKGFAQFIDGR